MTNKVEYDEQLEATVADVVAVERDRRRAELVGELTIAPGSTSRAAVGHAARRTAQGAVAVGTAGVLLAPQVGGVAAAQEVPPGLVDSPAPVSTIVDAALEIVAAPGEAVPVEAAPVDEAPVDAPPVDEPPVQEPPADEEPIDETPVDEAPGDETPVDETPVDESPGDETPVDEASGDETPGDETPVGELIDVVGDLVDVIDAPDPVEEEDAAPGDEEPGTDAPVEEETPGDGDGPGNGNGPDNGNGPGNGNGPVDLGVLEPIVDEVVDALLPDEDESGEDGEPVEEPTEAIAAPSPAPVPPPVSSSPPARPSVPTRPAPSRPAVQAPAPTPTPTIPVPTIPVPTTPIPTDQVLPDTSSRPGLVHPGLGLQPDSDVADVVRPVSLVHPTLDLQQAPAVEAQQVSLDSRIRAAQELPVTEERVDAWTAAVLEAWTAMQTGTAPTEEQVVAFGEVAPAPTLGWSYEVQPGDSLWTISEAAWGDGVVSSSHIGATIQLIHTWNAHNLGGDPDLIPAGVIIQLPLDTGSAA